LVLLNWTALAQKFLAQSMWNLYALEDKSMTIAELLEIYARSPQHTNENG
jgi:hypothetical protein